MLISFDSFDYLHLYESCGLYLSFLLLHDVIQTLESFILRKNSTWLFSSKKLTKEKGHCIIVMRLCIIRL